MRQIDFIAELAELSGQDKKQVGVLWELAMGMVLRKLCEGEVINWSIGQFYPEFFPASDTDITWVNGAGPLARASDLNRDRVIPKFVWDDRARRHVTDVAPVYGEIGNRIRAATAARQRTYLRSKSYKQHVWKRAREART